MSYLPPPGLKSSSNTPSPHPSLPARPPPSSVPNVAFKPAYPGAANSGSRSTFQGFAPRQVSAPTIASPAGGYSQYQGGYPPQPSYDNYGAQEQSFAAPQIRNPFPLPGQGGPGNSRFDPTNDPELEAQIAQWQSAYSQPATDKTFRSRFNAFEGAASGTNANATPLGSAAIASAAHADTGVATVVSGADGKQATVVRSGGGSQWTDSSLLEWDPSHFRIFVGNLAGEVTDESLLKAFARWPSVQKARVVRDKRTTKSKGFGFVSFSDGDEFFQAAREMNGKYIGSHPVLIKRSTTEIKAVVPKDRRNNKHGKNKGKGGGGGGGSGGGAGGSHTSSGVQKAGSKTKGGLKVIG